MEEVKLTELLMTHQPNYSWPNGRKASIPTIKHHKKLCSCLKMIHEKKNNVSYGTIIHMPPENVYGMQGWCELV